MLGVRRATVSVIAHLLKAKGLVSYRRGELTVTDRAGLEACSCECYYLSKEQMARTFMLRWTTICLYRMADQTFSQTVFR